MKIRTITLSVLGALTLLAGSQALADSMATLAISPATGAVTLQTRWAIGSGLGGFHHMSQDLSLGGGANQFYSIKGTTIPSGGDTLGFYRYIAASGAATNHADIGSKLTPDSYSALTSADPDVGYGAVNMYFIHHKTTGDYFSVIVPGSDTSSAVTDLKPMDGPGGPSTLGASGYFGLTFAASNLGYGLNQFYYLRTDAVTGYTRFGTLDPALTGTSADQFDLGIGGYNALAYTGTDVGYGMNKMYYLRLDPVTGYTVLGMLNPGTGATSDIANLGGIYSTLTFVPGDLNFGTGLFYTTGVYNPTWQSVSFAAIADRSISAGSFTVAPSASSNLPITLTVLSGSATISGPVGGVFTVTPTATGLIILQATQAGQESPTAYESNMLRQSFMVTGAVPASPDFTGDDQADILFKNSINGRIGLWRMNGTAPDLWIELPSASTEWQIVGTDDFTGDGQPDVLFKNSINGRIGLWRMNGTSPDLWIELPSASTEWQIVGTDDFTGDGQPDVLFKNSINGRIGLWRMNGTSPDLWIELPSASTEWQIVGTDDFTGDGQPDVLFKNSTNGLIGLWRMNGTAPDLWIDLPSATTEWQIVGTGDFTGDGQPDVLFKNSINGLIGLWRMNGTSPDLWIDLPSASTEWQIVNH